VERTKTPTAYCVNISRNQQTYRCDTIDELDRVALKLNNRPRKALGFMTPAEKFADLVAMAA
jgi:IS30 family transposase